MTIFISGGGKRGKTGVAQELSLALSVGRKLYYVATMIPADEVDNERVRHHVEDRAGMGFETTEHGRNILESLKIVDKTVHFWWTVSPHCCKMPFYRQIRIMKWIWTLLRGVRRNWWSLRGRWTTRSSSVTTFIPMPGVMIR